MWLGTKPQLDKIIVKDIPLLSTVVPVVDSARNLGVNIDSQLSMDVHVAAVCRSGYCQLRQLFLLCGMCVGTIFFRFATKHAFIRQTGVTL